MATRRAAGTAVVGVLFAMVTLVVSRNASAAPPTPGCPGPPVVLQYPPIGYARSEPPLPYQIPIVTHIVNGVLVGSGGPGGLVTVSIGPINATACGLAGLPSLTGSIKNSNVSVQEPIPVTIIAGPLSIASLYAEVQGPISAGLSRVPALNGGINATVRGTLKVTAIIDVSALGVHLPVPLVACSLIVGDANTPGLGPGGGPLSKTDLAVLRAKYRTDPARFNFFTPFVATTGTSVAPGNKVMSGHPVTGPPSAGIAEAVTNDVPLGQFFADIPPVPETPKTALGCSSAIAAELNSAVGLPIPAGAGYIKAPATFSINVG